MKKILFGMIAGIAICMAISFKQTFQVNNSTAEVIKKDSLLIFTDSKPVKEYIVIGKVNSPSMGLNIETHGAVKMHLIKRCKKNYPTAQGLILDYSDFPCKAEVITFK